jgi:hypothetical protein
MSATSPVPQPSGRGYRSGSKGQHEQEQQTARQGRLSVGASAADPQISPFSRMLKCLPPPTMTWSWTEIRNGRAASIKVYSL